MFAAAAVVSALLAALLAFSAIRKLSHRPEVVATYTRVGVPEDRLNYLALILLAAAAGVVVGLFWGPPGVVAAWGRTVARRPSRCGLRFRVDRGPVEGRWDPHRRGVRRPAGRSAPGSDRQ